MAGSIIERVRRDVAHIVTGGGFEVDITLTPPGEGAFVVRGLPVRINQTVEEHEGSYVNAPFSHVSIIEQDLIDAGFSPRKTNKLATMKGWLVTWTDSVQTWNYKCSETMPDSTVGLISLVLKDDN
jgi:hypothetical protein